jgi:hypothetical protein
LGRKLTKLRYHFSANKFDVDLTPKKSAIKLTIQKELARLAEEADESEEDEEDN